MASLRFRINYPLRQVLDYYLRGALPRQGNLAEKFVDFLRFCVN